MNKSLNKYLKNLEDKYKISLEDSDKDNLYLIIRNKEDGIIIYEIMEIIGKLILLLVIVFILNNIKNHFIEK